MKKNILISALRWIAAPIAYLVVFVIAYYLGKIIFNWIMADSALLFFKNPQAQKAIESMCELVSHGIGTIGAMMAVSKVAPSHKATAAKVIGIATASAITSLYLIMIARNIELELTSIAGWVGKVSGVIAGWWIVKDFE